MMRVAQDAIAVSHLIDWRPHIAPLFTKCLRHFELPVGAQHLMVPNVGKLESAWFAHIIVWLLGTRTSRGGSR